MEYISVISAAAAIIGQFVMMIFFFARLSAKINVATSETQKLYGEDNRPVFMYQKDCARKTFEISTIIKEQFRDLKQDLMAKDDIALRAREKMFNRLDDQEKRLILMEEKLKNG